MPSLSEYNIRIYSKVELELEDYKTENRTRVDTQIRVRENGGSLNFNFISLLNSVVDENWVCRHRLLQFVLGKWRHVQCSDLCKLFVNGKFPKRFQCVCARIDLLFIIFVCSLYSPWATIRLSHHFGFVCMLILAYSVRIFHAKYVMFHVGWRKSLKGSTTPAAFFQFTVSQRQHVFVRKWLRTLWIGPASVMCLKRTVLYSEC